MEITLKKLKIAEHMSDETTPFTADIYVNGIEAGYAKNDGCGGSTYYHTYEGKRDLITSAERFCLTLPEKKYPADFGMKAFSVPMNLEVFIDNLVETELIRKANKKIEKKMETCIMWGSPSLEGSYTEVNFKRPLNTIPVLQLQNAVNEYKKKLVDGKIGRAHV